MTQILVAQGQGGDSLSTLSQYDHLFEPGDRGILTLTIPNTPFDIFGQLEQKLAEEVATKIGGTVTRSENVITINFTVSNQSAQSTRLAHAIPLVVGLAILASIVIGVLVGLILKPFVDLIIWILSKIQDLADALKAGDLTAFIPLMFGGVVIWAVWSAFTEQKPSPPIIMVRR